MENIFYSSALWNLLKVKLMPISYVIMANCKLGWEHKDEAEAFQNIHLTPPFPRAPRALDVLPEHNPQGI